MGRAGGGPDRISELPHRQPAPHRGAGGVWAGGIGAYAGQNGCHHALSDGGVEQKLVTLSGVRRAAVLEKLVTVEGEIRFPTPPAAVLDLSGNASVGDLNS